MFALQPDSSSQQHRQIAAERQAQTSAAMAVLKRIFDLAEFVEDRFVMFRRNADAGVRDLEQDLLILKQVGRNDNLSTGRELERVGDQVAQNLRDFSFIGVQRRKIRRIFEDQIDGVVVGQQRLQHALQRAEELVHFKALGANADFAGLDLWRDRAGR